MNDTVSSRRRLALAWSASGLAGGLWPALTHAQGAWPTKAVRFVVPFAPGGSSEIVARSTAVEMTKLLGQSVFVDNKPGGAGNVAMTEVARSDDQHTLILGHIGTLAVNPYIFDKLPYDPVKDFRPISLLAKVPSLYLVHPDLPVKDLKEFVALAKKKPGQLNYGSAGNGSAGHLAMEYLKMATGTFMVHVPYRGTGPQLTDLMAGRLDAASVGASAVLQFIKTGKLRCIATGTAQRIPQLPDVPTVAEQGYPGFEMTQWYGLLAPATLPPAVDAKLAAAAAKAVREPAALERLNHDAAIAVGSTPAEFAKFIEQERARWKVVIARAKIKPDN
ncbi:Bug family tripartite tricarboxylate transporter substrate binding protein [Piscinibacter gummiphilus]|uniref:ABC transporter substrate-binding protein n=1 Tax=Piscinibacter gummiphilus TaxID=946333 RepID=A0A1W6L2R7_9BURK|nr:tripartite tricarboxylate transporter substrate binding protein [Piscinibacter gummiphilus]ARN18500.1 ABC transporter substrate-binding protein [Piscinibacter gummiphilus]ATU63128.1 tripartite tricarboxylate transporter substrate binding protein [Piscinibacter gummiphilus]GLS95445.1 exported protein [Piscinibacter gummiphilus]